MGFWLSNAMIVVFGLVQVAAGVLLLPPKTRVVAAALAALAFFVSTALIFLAGNAIFGMVSLVPTLLACIIVYRSAGFNRNKALDS